MLLFDIQLKFARDLIGHWSDIRRGAPVPLEVDLDPRTLLPILGNIGIVELMEPSKLIIELAGAAVRRRFGREIRHMNWIDLVPPTLGEAGQRARERIRRQPCGFYHKFTVARDGADMATAETLLLPLRRRNITIPHAVIGMTQEVGKQATSALAGWLTPSAHISHYFMEFVDIE